MTDPNDPKATEVRILSENGGIIRWSGEAADTIAGILSAFAEAAGAKGKPLPAPIVIPPCKVQRKVTVVEGYYYDDGRQGTIRPNDDGEPGEPIELLGFLPPQGAAPAWQDEKGEMGPVRVFRFEVEVIDPADMKAPTEKPRLKIVPS